MSTQLGPAAQQRQWAHCFPPQDGGESEQARARKRRLSNGVIYMCKHTYKPSHILHHTQNTACQARWPICFAPGPITRGLAGRTQDGGAETGGGIREKINRHCRPLKRTCLFATEYQYVVIGKNKCYK